MSGAFNNEVVYICDSSIKMILLFKILLEKTPQAHSKKCSCPFTPY